MFRRGVPRYYHYPHSMRRDHVHALYVGEPGRFQAIEVH